MHWLKTIKALAFAAGILVSGAASAEEYKLVMFEESGCYYCDLWKSEIGQPKYAKTIEGKIAPIQLVDIDDGAPGGLELHTRVVYTPTFVLFKDGLEVGKIEGYPGEEFFWWFLDELLELPS